MKIEQLQSAMIQAMKEKNRVKKEVIADMIACAKNMAIEKKCKDNITEDIVDAAILKSKKMCQEQIDTCPANRPDLLEGYKLCMTYINELAPKMMSEDEIAAAVKELLDASFENETPNKGVAMKIVMAALKGKADGKIINNAVNNYLN
jgi:uncharacterized protein YqeY